MSVEMVLVCEQCNVQLELGHQGFSGDRFLFGDVWLMKTLGEMLFEHKNHTLRFVDKDYDQMMPVFTPDPDYGHRVYDPTRVYQVNVLGAEIDRTG